LSSLNFLQGSNFNILNGRKKEDKEQTSLTTHTHAAFQETYIPTKGKREYNIEKK